MPEALGRRYAVQPVATMCHMDVIRWYLANAFTAFYAGEGDPDDQARQARWLKVLDEAARQFEPAIRDVEQGLAAAMRTVMIDRADRHLTDLFDQFAAGIAASAAMSVVAATRFCELAGGLDVDAPAVHRLQRLVSDRPRSGAGGRGGTRRRPGR